MPAMAAASTGGSGPRASASWHRLSSAGLKRSIMPTTGSSAADSPAAMANGLHVDWLSWDAPGRAPACVAHTSLVELEDDVLEVVHVHALLVLAQVLAQVLPLHLPQRLPSCAHALSC